jgi:hypothetical protein
MFFFLSILWILRAGLDVGGGRKKRDVDTVAEYRTIHNLLQVKESPKEWPPDLAHRPMCVLPGLHDWLITSVWGPSEHAIVFDRLVL